MREPPTEPTPRERCYRCMRPRSVCWCAELPDVETKTRLLILQHPREEFMPIGSARMAGLAVRGAEIIVGTNADADPRVEAALTDPTRTPILLWPGPLATDLTTHVFDRPVTLVVVDGTWHLAKKLVRLNPRIAALPHFSLTPSAPSEYRIRREPKATCVSTVEAVIEALSILEKRPFDEMRAPFRYMISRQIEFAEAGGGRGRHLPKGPPKPRPLPALLRQSEEVIVMAGEANAWPVRSVDRPRQELVHVVAARVSAREGVTAVYSQLIAPKGPISPTTPHHVRLSEEQIRSGVPFATFLASFEAFLGSPPLPLVFWGPHAAGLLARDGATLDGPTVDLRRASQLYLRASSASIQEASTALGADPLLDRAGVLSAIEGRAGLRLSSAVAITEFMMARARL